MFLVILQLFHCCRRNIYSIINFLLLSFFFALRCLHRTCLTWVVSAQCWLYKISKPVQIAFLGNPNNVVSSSGILFETWRKSLEFQYNVVAQIYQPKSSSLCSWFALKLLALSLWRGGWRLKAILRNEVINTFSDLSQQAFLLSISSCSCGIFHYQLILSVYVVCCLFILCVCMFAFSVNNLF